MIACVHDRAGAWIPDIGKHNCNIVGHVEK